jgi:hypothetical protein
MRYLLGVVVFATAIAATQALAHILPRLRHHPIRSESLEHLNVHDSFRRCHRALFWKSSVSGGPGSTPLNVRSHVPYPSKGRTVPRLMLISIRGHLVPGPELPVECVSRVHAVKREFVMRHPAAAIIYARLMKTPRKQAFNITRLRPTNLPSRPAVLISRQQLTELFRSLR